MKTMYKKVLAFLLTMAMVSSFAMVVMAGDNGNNGNNAGEAAKAAVDGKSAEGEVYIDLSSLLDGITSEIGDDAEICEALKELKERYTDETGSINIDSIEDVDYVMSLLFAGRDEAEEPGDVEDVLGASFDELETAICMHLLDETGKYMEAGDETVFSHVIADIDAQEDGTIHMLGYFMIMNYDVDEECPDDLIVKNGEGLTELLTFAKNDEGVYEVTGYVTAEEDEGYAESVAMMSKTMDMDPDEFYEDLAICEIVYVSDLFAFMEVHPEYDHVEYNGEMMTLDDLDRVIYEDIDEYLALYAIDVASDDAEDL